MQVAFILTGNWFLLSLKKTELKKMVFYPRRLLDLDDLRLK
jgi:hypothetical protein